MTVCIHYQLNKISTQFTKCKFTLLGRLGHDTCLGERVIPVAGERVIPVAEERVIPVAGERVMPVAGERVIPVAGREQYQCHLSE